MNIFKVCFLYKKNITNNKEQIRKMLLLERRRDKKKEKKGAVIQGDTKEGLGFF